MRTLRYVLAGLWCLSAPLAYAQDHQVAVDIEFVSRYIWRGFDLSASKGNRPALQPAVTYTHGASGLWLNAWTSFITGSRGKVDAPNEVDFTVGWDRFINNRFGITAGYIQYTFPDAAAGLDSHSEEIFIGLLTDNNPINPYANLFIDFGALEGLYFLAGVDLPVGQQQGVFPLMLDISLGFQSYDVIRDANLKQKSGVSDINIGLSTELGTDNVTFSPAIYWTITGFDEVNDDDELWIKLGISFGN